jgi:hypothetical protein
MRLSGCGLIRSRQPFSDSPCTSAFVRTKKALVHYPANTYPGQNEPLADNTHFNTYGAYELAK